MLTGAAQARAQVTASLADLGLEQLGNIEVTSVSGRAVHLGMLEPLPNRAPERAPQPGSAG